MGRRGDWARGRIREEGRTNRRDAKMQRRKEDKGEEVKKRE